MTTQLSRIELHALGRALQSYRRLSARHAVEVAEMLRADGWTETAKYCAKCCQQREQNLSYEEVPPCELELDDRVVANDACRQAMAKLLRRLLDNGLSRFEPSPERACIQAEESRRKEDGTPADDAA